MDEARFAAQRRTPLVLVVDDDPDHVRLCGLILEPCGYEVVGASDGQQGLEAASRLRPDLIVLDVNLGRCSGFDVLARLRAEPSLSGVLVAILTTQERTEDLLSAKRLGAVAYWVKPYDGDTFVRQVGSILTTHGAAG